MRLIASRLIVCLVAVALAALGGGHRLAAAEDEARIAAYVLGGGDFSDICGDGPAHQDRGCEACRLVGEALVPEVVPGLVAPGRVVERLWNAAAAVERRPDRAFAARAPPGAVHV
ncbi:hypothetical protein AADZ90_019620 [Aestuariibius sp. 2305UL40-4]|uniref:hypothetical protein n=1 Tax=Aestuariibius violaceus TaxID=3234132 RepID=UPI00345E7903